MVAGAILKPPLSFNSENMEFKTFLKSKRSTFYVFFLCFLIIGAAVTGLQSFKYGTKSKLLVIQKGASGVDPFAVSRSVEYLSGLFSQVVYSNSFFESVVKSEGYNIDANYFTSDSTKQMKLWRRTVSAKSLENTGIINISVYHPDPVQAKQIALAVNNVLMTQNARYQGLGDSVEVSILDQPIVSNYPIKPNLLLNFAVILFGSLAAGFIYVYIFPEDKYSLRLMGQQKTVKGNAKWVNEQNFLNTNDLKNELDGDKHVQTPLNQAPGFNSKPAQNREFNPENRGNIGNIL